MQGWVYAWTYVPINHRRSDGVAHAEVVNPTPDVGDLHRLAAGDACVG
jgi:hypothetical protein